LVTKALGVPREFGSLAHIMNSLHPLLFYASHFTPKAGMANE